MTTTVLLTNFDDTLASGRGKNLGADYRNATRAIAERVLVMLENARLLHGSRALEDEDHCRQSADDIRRRLEAEIVAASGGPLQASLRKLRAAAKAFVDSAGSNSRHHINNPGEFSASLAALRDAFGPEVGWIASTYGIDIESQLAGIVPGARFA